MDPRIWGPYGWYFLHTVCENYIGKNKLEYYNCIKSIGHVIPCHECREHFQEMFYDSFPGKALLETNANILGEWIFDTHNRVNKRLRKPIMTQSNKPNYMEKLSHAKFFKFVDIIIESGYEFNKKANVSLQSFQYYLSFVSSLDTVFPCLECRKIIKTMWKKTKLCSTSTIGELYAWYMKIRDKLLEHHLFVNDNLNVLFKCSDEPIRTVRTKQSGIATIGKKLITKKGKKKGKKDIFLQLVNTEGKTISTNLLKNTDKGKKDIRDMIFLTDEDIAYKKKCRKYGF